MREIEIRAGAPEARDVEALAVPWIEGAVEAGPWWVEPARAWIERQRAAGQKDPAGWVSTGHADRPDLFVACCQEGIEATRGVRAAAGIAVRAAGDRALASVGLLVPAGLPDAAEIWQAAAEGLLLGDWRYDGLRDPEARRPVPSTRVLHAADPEEATRYAAAVERGRVLAMAQNETRELVTLPGNIVTPAYLAERALALAGKHGFTAEAWGRDRLEAEGFGGLLAVARGSVQEPRFLILEHEGDGGDPRVVVGKGVTFDTGGISLKPAKGMEDMKYDMAGAAATIGVLIAAAALRIPQRVVGLIPATENMPSGTAVKPGDVIRGLSGRSIEVVNTDAEGRLILSDALTYAQRLSPRAIVDMATLTGACVIALGHHAVGLLSPSDELAARLDEAGRRSGERVWRLPLWPEYRRQLDSEIADVKNTGGRPAGTITAAWFLRDFVQDGVEWAHLDIAGTAWAEEAAGWQPKGATGVGVRLLHAWLRGGS